MKMKSYYEVNLFGVFAQEKIKYHDQFTVSYNNKNQQLKYAMEGHGVLTVKFGRDSYGENREDFFYSPEGKPEESYHVYITAASGGARRFFDDFLQKVPRELRDVAKSYGDKEKRRSIGIDEAQASAKKRKKLSFGKDER